MNLKKLKYLKDEIYRKIGFIFYYLKPRPLFHKISKKLSSRKLDDFNWKYYSSIYKIELIYTATKNTRIINENDYIFKEDKLIKKNNNILPLHPNCRLLYETILQLDPKSILELGCGGGDNLANLKMLNENINSYGLDISADQISLLYKRHTRLNSWISIVDAKQKFPNYISSVNLAFTQAVIMHIHNNDGHLMALQNLFDTAKNYVVLMENWKSHNFVHDIKNLYEEGKIKWSNLYLYFKRSPEFDNKPHLLIASSSPLDDYELLNDDSILQEKAF